MITISESELSRFFAVEAATLDAEIPWPYNQFTYQIVQGECSLTFVIEPAELEVHIVLRKNDAALFTLKAVGIEELIYREERNSEVLELRIDSGNRLWLKLKPEIEIIQEAGKDV